MKIIAYNIKYDVDDENDLIDLPETLIFDSPNVYEFPAHCGNLEDSISEWLSDQITQETDFCHNGFEWDYVYDGLDYLPKRFTTIIENGKIYVQTNIKSKRDANKVDDILRSWSLKNLLQLDYVEDLDTVREWCFKRIKEK